MIRYLWIFIVLAALMGTGCRSTSGKRVNKDIVGINEQLYDLEKNQIKDGSRLKKLESQVGKLVEEKDQEKKDDKGKDPNNIYQEAYKKYLDQKYAEAIELFSRLTERFKDDALIDNALYWQAESYFKSNQPDKALKQYQLIYRYFPFSNKADYALYKIGLLYDESKDYPRALLALNRLLEEYPSSDLYKIVSLKIKEIKNKNRRKR